jgi:hypothetical protein
MSAIPEWRRADWRKLFEKQLLKYPVVPEGKGRLEKTGKTCFRIILVLLDGVLLFYPVA